MCNVHIYSIYNVHYTDTVYTIVVPTQVDVERFASRKDTVC